MFAIYHLFEVDGGFGDAVDQKTIIAVCENEEVAKKFCKIHDRTQIYDSPYDDLHKGTLDYEELNIPNITEENIYETPWNEDNWERFY